jgi:NitT/TauT family transport system ATP-binding protein
MIAVDDLDKQFVGAGRNVVRALERLSFSVAQGEFVSIVGPSGCGKTTLLRIVAGTIPPSRGSVSVNGIPVTGPSKEMGVVFQTPVLFPWRTILENVLVPADVRRAPRAMYADKARKMLAVAGLDGFADEYPWRLSGGMQQRAAICRALVYDPAVLLLDEPFGALDAMTREVMNSELMRLCALTKSSVLLITHSISEAVFLSDRVLVMSSRPGRLVGDIKIDLRRPRSIDVMGTERFAALTHEVRTLLASHHALDAH